MANMTNNLRQKWEEFLSGEWTLDPPTRRGTYAVADRQGNHTTSNVIVYKTDGRTGYAMHGVNSEVARDIWGGYFWSIPLPDLPPITVAKTPPLVVGLP